MPAPRRSRGWIPFYLVVLGLAVGAGVILVVYNLKQQLKPEDLQAAWDLWKKKGPKDYVLIYTVKKGEDQDEERFQVRVVRGKTVSVERTAGQHTEPLEQRLNIYYGMDELFAWVTDYMRQDAEPAKPRVYIRAVFDPKDSHLAWYVRRVMGSRERVEITVLELQTADKAGGS
jgi:hypothetical protein